MRRTLRQMHTSVMGSSDFQRSSPPAVCTGGTGVSPLEGRTHRLLETAPGSHGTACARFVGCPRRVLEEIGPLLIQEHLTAITHAGQADANSRVPSRALRIHRILMPRLYGSPRQAPRTVRISDADV